jgi:hypothetical protein
MSDLTRHSPSPWTVGGPNGRYLVDAHGRAVALAHPDSTMFCRHAAGGGAATTAQPWRLNAAVVVAAPGLLAAAERVLDLTRRESGDHFHELCEALADLRVQAELARTPAGSPIARKAA